MFDLAGPPDWSNPEPPWKFLACLTYVEKVFGNAGYRAGARSQGTESLRYDRGLFGVDSSYALFGPAMFSQQYFQ